jgi:hypothetical protein
VEEEIPTLPHERNWKGQLGSWHNDHQFFDRPEGGSWTRYDYIFGNYRGTGLFIQQSYGNIKSTDAGYTLPESVSPDEILWCLKNQMFFVENSVASSVKAGSIKRSSLSRAIHSSTTSGLDALTKAYCVYQNLPDATIDLGVLHRSLSQTKWARRVAAGKGTCFSQSAALSCLAYFEDGRSDIDPDVLEGAFAMSAGDSIYISERVGISHEVSTSLIRISFSVIHGMSQSLTTSDVFLVTLGDQD